MQISFHFQIELYKTRYLATQYANCQSEKLVPLKLLHKYGQDIARYCPVNNGFLGIFSFFNYCFIPLCQAYFASWSFMRKMPTTTNSFKTVYILFEQTFKQKLVANETKNTTFVYLILWKSVVVTPLLLQVNIGKQTVKESKFGKINIGVLRLRSI